MARYVGLLRAVNVGGTGKLPMAELRRLCAEAGFSEVATYIASGNVAFSSALAASEVKAVLEAGLCAYAGRDVPVMVRTGAEVADVPAENPFAEQAGNRVMVIFLDDVVPLGAADQVTGRADEEIVFGEREIYVYYPSGQGRSKLKIPAGAGGTARNMNTVAKLVEMLGAA